MTDLDRITDEQDQIARMGLATYTVALSPANLASELEANLWLTGGGYLQLRDVEGHLVAEVSATSVQLTTNLTQYEPGTGPLRECAQPWTLTVGHEHSCRHTTGHAYISDLPHECGCGARLPI